jgi:hypothetical protein
MSVTLLKMSGSILKYLKRPAGDVQTSETAKKSKGLGKAVTKEKYEKEVRRRKFLPQWLDKFPWLQYNNDTMTCKVCTKFPDLADSGSSFLSGCTSFHSATLQSHELSQRHKRCQQKYLIKESKAEGPMDYAIKNVNKEQLNVLEKLFNTAYFIYKNELPFTMFPKQISLLVKIGINKIGGDRFKSDNACRRCIIYFKKYLFITDLFKIVTSW